MADQLPWDDLFEDGRFPWKRPDPAVVRIAPRWRKLGLSRIHDLGCGAGRHMSFLLTQGFTVVGSDFSRSGLAACCEQLDTAALPRILVRAEMTGLPFRSGTFDATVATNVLNHGTRATLQETIDEIHRTLRPGAEILLTVLNTWDWRFGSGEEVERNSWVLAVGPEAGILHHFFDQDDLRGWLSAFQILDLKRVRGVLDLGAIPGDQPISRDAWQVLARKSRR